jgi:hypothetical protein
MNLQYWIINNNTFPKKRNCKWFVIKKLISQYFLKYSIREIYVMDHSSIWIDVPNFKKLLFVYLFSFVSYHQNPNKISSKIDDSYCCFLKKKLFICFCICCCAITFCYWVWRSSSAWSTIKTIFWIFFC